MQNKINNKFLGFTREEIESSIAKRFELVTETYPDNIAIKTDQDQLTYHELNTKANQIARLIREKLPEKQPICIILNQSIEQFIALIAILKTGNPYVILDPLNPQERLNYIANSLHSKLALTNNKYWKLAQEITPDNCQLINLDNIETSLGEENLNLPISATDLYTIIFTSGSTGKPKGVKRNQRYILHRLWLETNDYKISSQEKISLLYSTSFSASTSDIYDTLLNGATLCIYDLKEKGVYPLTEWIIKEQISFLHLPSIFFREWLETLTGKPKFSSLRHLTLSGRLYSQDVEKARQFFTPETIFIQRLASSETGMSTRFIIDKNTELKTKIIPVGYPVADKEILLLDELGNKLGFNQGGEIAVKSRYLADGYWENEELTKQKFIPCEDQEGMFIYLTGDLGKMQPDGCLELLGRKDFQVKIRDYTVNLTEIEIGLLDLVEVKEVAVIAHEYSPEDLRIIAYVSLAENCLITVKELNQILSNKLPEYMIPSVYVFLDSLPFTEIGKINRQALPIPSLTRKSLDNPYVAPSNFMEEKLTEIWQDVLKIEEIGINDNFLELGGNSLLATQIINRIINQLGVQVSLGDFLNTPTIAKMAQVISLILSESTPEDELTSIIDDLKNLSPEEVEKLLSNINIQ
jgi:amino acid adenylation domain-containing protein